MLLKNLQSFEVVALNENVLGCIPIGRVLLVWLERCSGRGLGCANCVALAWPCEAKSLGAFLDVFVEDRLENIEIYLAVGYDLGKEFSQLGRGFCGEVRG